MAILGSGSLVSQLASEGLIDEYQFVVNPTVLGAGRTMFEGLARRLDFQLARWRAFANGKVFLSYRPRS
jgi:dihydrofolate reductase